MPRATNGWCSRCRRLNLIQNQTWVTRQWLVFLLFLPLMFTLAQNANYAVSLNTCPISSSFSHFSVSRLLFNHHAVEEGRVITFSLGRTEYHFSLDACGGGGSVLLVSASQQHRESFVGSWECGEKRRRWQARAICQLVRLSLHGLLLLGVTVQVRFRICQQE